MYTIRLYKNEDVYPFQAAYCEHFYAFKYISNTIGIKDMLQGVTVFKFIALQMSITRSFVPCFKSASLCQCSIDTRVKPSCRLKLCGWSGWFYLYTTVTGHGRNDEGIFVPIAMNLCLWITNLSWHRVQQSWPQCGWDRKGVQPHWIILYGQSALYWSFHTVSKASQVQWTEKMV